MSNPFDKIFNKICSNQNFWVYEKVYVWYIKSIAVPIESVICINLHNNCFTWIYMYDICFACIHVYNICFACIYVYNICFACIDVYNICFTCIYVNNICFTCIYLYNICITGVSASSAVLCGRTQGQWWTGNSQYVSLS